MARESKQKSTSYEDDAPEPPAPAAGAPAQERTAAVDALLDEIDGVLESNAESFVSGFIQKGGQ